MTTPTEIATAAFAHCIGPYNEFVQSLEAKAKASDAPGSFLTPGEYRTQQAAAMREYAFAHALDTYISGTTAF